MVAWLTLLPQLMTMVMTSSSIAKTKSASGAGDTGWYFDFYGCVRTFAYWDVEMLKSKNC